ncbi:MAG TPA: NlpC/P60 family protein [Clostridia bacterium]
MNPIDEVINKYAFSDSNSTSQNAPQSVTTAQSDIGDQSYNGYCQAFVEQATYGKQGLFGATAYDAWNNFNKKGQATQGTQGIQPGDIIYFSPTQQVPAGHTGIYEGGNNFVSATDDGVQSNDLSKWQQATGQQILGYVHP